MPTPIVPIAPTRSPPHGVDLPRRIERRRFAGFAPFLFLLAFCGQAAFAEATHAAAAKDSAPAKADSAIVATPAIVPTAYELQLLYTDRTWIWKNGAAYFAKDNRRLEAWTSGQDSASVAEGRWLVTEDGKMCTELAWRSKSYKGKPKRTCYSHQIKDGAIEQRKDPDGEWYSFKRTPEDPSDEYRKFEPGNTKAAQFEEARKLIDAKN
ncbi:MULTISPECIES: DUF995 domain-containing protein [unclassified Mesorhizobium]|uniref:DUF995 domain-containing protein n=1 Tax=unclassified Mesorhizobium TaxID=325217 RepID=UPI001CCAC284|nr:MULTISPECIES: DUF995 domain-containing protein [unclassified Mesorhizobium]MBZ9741237.1 DUF995 domain-containing protein [Mesorhizobium sp. CO1-1-4]MBZ9804515.1 DUF995 domain-containing protein [Mesorhizobium sp. ES1-6]